MDWADVRSPRDGVEADTQERPAGALAPGSALADGMWDMSPCTTAPSDDKEPAAADAPSNALIELWWFGQRLRRQTTSSTSCSTSPGAR
eukprot:6293418-Alexandrium_andersonii.AAC.1